jgi:hypothetical protein
MEALKAQWQGRLTSLIRDFHFRIGTWFYCGYCRNNPIDVQADDRPSRIAEDNDCNDPIREILLVADVLVGGHKDIKCGFFRGCQKFAVAQRIPAKVFRLFDGVVREE